MALLVAAVVLVRETSRLQLFHLRLCVRQHCQFVLINLLLGSSLVSNVEAAAAHFCSGGDDTPSLDLSSLIQKGNSALYLYPNKHRHTWTIMCFFAMKNGEVSGAKYCSSWISHSQFLDAPRWFSAGDGTPGGNPYLLDPGTHVTLLRHVWLTEGM